MKRALILASAVLLFSSLLAHAAPITWTGGGGDGLWNTPKNWSTNTVPTSSDDVTIGSATVTVTGLAAFANTVTCSGTLNINGSLNIASTSSFTTLNLQGGVLAPNGASTITGPLTLSGGSLIGAGNVTISGITTVMANGSLSSSANVTNTGTINILGSSQLDFSTFTNNGTVNIQSEGGAAGVVGSTINNNGTIAKTVGTGSSILSFTTLTNTKSIVADTGTLMVEGGGGTQTGSFSASSGAILLFSVGNLTLSTGSTLGGTGTIDIAGAIFTLSADVTVNTTTLQLDGGAGFVFLGTNNLTINSGTVSWNSGTIGSTGGTGTLTVSGGTTVNIATALSHGLSRILDLKGTVNLNGDLSTGSNMTIENLAVFNIKADNSITGSGNITVNGTFEKTGGTGISNVALFPGMFNTTGATITVSSGTLNLQVNGTSNLTGTWTVDGTLEFSCNTGTATYNLTGINITGSGTTVLAAGGVWNLMGTASKVGTPTFQFTGGTIQGTGNLTILGTTATWSGGSMLGTSPGTITISTGVTLTMSNSLSLSGFTVVNKGTVNLSTATTNLSLAGVTWTNTGILDFQDNGSIVNGLGNPSTFNNNGTVEKTGGSTSGQSSISFNGTFNNNKTVSLTAGNLDLSTPQGTSQGAWTVASGAALTFVNPSGASLWTMNAGTTMTGAGTLFLDDTTWTLTAALTIQTTTFDATLSTITGAFDLTLDSGTINLDGLTRTGGTMKAPKAGSKVIVESGGFSLNTSTFDTSSSNVTVNGPVNMTNSAAFLNEAGGKVTLDIPTTLGGSAITGDSTTTITNKATGTITVGTDTNAGITQSISTQGTIVNDGTITVPPSHTLNLTMSPNFAFEELLGTVQVNQSIINVTGANIDVTGGLIGGSGSINGVIDNQSGTIQAGTTTPGVLGLTAPLTEGSGSTMKAVIGGTAPVAPAGTAPPAGGTFDQINSTSSMALGGTLNLSFANGFTPAPTQSFNILNFASSTGSFSSVITPNSTCTAKLTTTATSLSVSFTSSNVSVTISPTAVTLKVNTQQQFTDTVTNGCGNGVTWKVKEGAAGGTVNQKGLYTAPGTPGTFHVVVTSVADKTKSATATVTVTTASAKTVTVSPQAAVLQPGGSLHLQANTAVDWTVAEGVSGGSITTGGSYTAASKPGLYHILATSAADSTQHAVVNIAVVNGKLRSAYVANLDKNSVAVLTSITSNGIATGQLKETESVSTGQAPAALAISADGKYLLSANHDSNDVSLFAVSPADGTLHPIPGPSIDTGTHPSAIAFDSAGGMAFVANHDSDDLSVFSVNPASGQMVLLGMQALAAGDQPSAIAALPGGSLMFAANSGADTVAGFSYDAAGLLTPFSGSPFAAGSKPAAAVIDLSGKFLFVANRGSGDVSVFAIDASNKTLHEVSGSPFPAGKGAAAVALDITDSYLFVADHDANDIAEFQIDSDTGELNLLSHTRVSATAPSSLAVDPSGQYVYVTSDKTGGVTTLKLNLSTGALTPGPGTQSSGRTSAIVVVRQRP